jgi:hypothetical protein
MFFFSIDFIQHNKDRVCCSNKIILEIELKIPSIQILFTSFWLNQGQQRLRFF